MRSFAVAALALIASTASVPVRAADEADELMPGRVVIIKTGKLAKFVAKPPTGETFDLPDPGTNNPTIEGGLLEMFDDSPFTPAGVDFVLPPTGWKGLGGGASKGFKYSGAGSSGDPCRVVLVKAKVVKAVCKGPNVTLPTPFQGQVGIVLSIGTDTKRYCAVFGGEETKNDPTLLKRKTAPAPGFCPLDLNSSTTIPNSTSTTVTSSTTTTDTVPAPTTTSTSTTTTASGTITTTSTTLPPSASTTSTSPGPPGTTTSTFGTTVTSTSSTSTSTILVPCGEAEAPFCLGGECPVPGTHCVSSSGTCGCIFTTTTTM